MASTQVEAVSASAGKLRVVLACALVVAALVGFYLLSEQGAAARWGALVAGLVLAVVVFFTAEMGKRLIAFGRDAWREVKKVVWPSRKETLQTTVFVFAFAVVIAIFLWTADKFLQWVLFDLILGWER